MMTRRDRLRATILTLTLIAAFLIGLILRGGA